MYSNARPRNFGRVARPNAPFCCANTVGFQFFLFQLTARLLGIVCRNCGGLGSFTDSTMACKSKQHWALSDTKMRDRTFSSPFSSSSANSLKKEGICTTTPLPIRFWVSGFMSPDGNKWKSVEDVRPKTTQSRVCISHEACFKSESISQDSRLPIPNSWLTTN